MKIKITKCNAVGEGFSNLTPDSIHEVIPPPEGFKGIWVMGKGSPVKVLRNEYVIYNK